MKEKHLTYDNLAEHVAGLHEGRKALGTAEHLERCAACRARYEELTRLFSPRYPGDMRPGEGLRRRVMDSYDRIAAGEKAGSGFSAFVQSGRRIAFASGIAAVLIVSAALFFLAGPLSHRDAGLAVRYAAGNVTADGRHLAAGITLNEGAVISVPSGALVRIGVERVAELVLSGPANMSIEKARVTWLENTLVLGFDITEGTLLSSIHAGGGTAQCRYRTAQAVIGSLSTEYLVTVSGDVTSVTVLSGRVVVESVRSGRKRAFGSNEKATVTSELVASLAGRDDLLFAERLRAAGRAGTGGQAPWVVPQERPQYDGPGKDGPAVLGTQTEVGATDAGKLAADSQVNTGPSDRREIKSARKEAGKLRKRVSEMKRSGLQRSRRNR